MRWRTSGGMPVPVSVTSTTTIPSSTRVRNVSVPPSGIASTALMIRFASASRSSAARPPISGTCPSSAVTRIVRPLAWAWSRQRIVEVVRDAAGELPQRLQPLLADHHLLGVLHVGQRLLQPPVHLAQLLL